MVIGYTTGVYDLFHVGHVRLLRNAKAMCDRLIVGVTSDHLVGYKGKKSVIPFDERLEIVSACRYVDLAVAQSNMDKMEAYERFKFDIMFVGDDWFRTDKWNGLDKQFADIGVNIIYFPYTENTSSSLINETLRKLRSDDPL
jgi:glycerol-3-phosphate cytidylyltransferase